MICVNQWIGGELTFWTLMLWLVLLKIRLARIALANRRAYIGFSHKFSESSETCIPGSISLLDPAVGN